LDSDVKQQEYNRLDSDVKQQELNNRHNIHICIQCYLVHISSLVCI